MLRKPPKETFSVRVSCCELDVEKTPEETFSVYVSCCAGTVSPDKSSPLSLVL